ncbi:MAG: hypothetical protein QW451_01080 [Candidatus Aenigmatarchaeota archaeon]
MKSSFVIKKARKLLRENRVKKEIESEKRIHFKVKGETEDHFVIFDKLKGKFSCDCPYFTLKEKECSHIKAAKILLKNQDKL